MTNVANNKKIIYLIFCFLSITIFFPYPALYATPVVVSGGPENDYESWIIRLNDNRLMIIFDRNPDWQSGDLYVTFSTNNGNTWDSVLSIIPDFGDQATLSFLQLPGDTLRLWYASNEDGQYGIYAAWSIDGLTWSREGRIDLGWSASDMYYDPTVVMESDSSLTMSYRGPSGAYIVHRPYGGDWDTLKTMVGSSGYRPRVMKHTNSTYLYAYHRNIGGGNYEVFIRTSTDRINWTSEVQLTFNNNSHDPFPNETPDGAYLVYYATYLPPAYNLYRRKSFNAIDWKPEEQITQDPTNNTQPHFFIESDEIYLVWAHAVSYPYNHDVYFERFPYPGIEEKDIELILHLPISVEIYPNPCAKNIKIFSNAKRSVELEISLYDVQGQVIEEPIKKIMNAMSAFHISTTHLPNGTYFVKVNCAQGVCFKKFVVVR